MATHAPAFPANDRDLYPLHEEDEVSETEIHDLLTDYLCDALRARFPDWRIFRNVCIYWESGNTNLYRAPDVFAVKEPIREPELRVYHTWQDPPVNFVAEIGSRSTFREDEGLKLEVYAHAIKALEYLYFDREHAVLQLWRLGVEGYEAVAPEPNGRLRSLELGLEFGIDPTGFLGVYTLEGERLRSHQEAERDRQEAERDRQEAEARAAALAERVSEETRQRQAAETRAAELERELAELRAKLGEHEAGPAPDGTGRNETGDSPSP